MRRIHSGEDKGRGLKSWNTKEQEIFKLRTNPKTVHLLQRLLVTNMKNF